MIRNLATAFQGNLKTIETSKIWLVFEGERQQTRERKRGGGKSDLQFDVEFLSSRDQRGCYIHVRYTRRD